MEVLRLENVSIRYMTGDFKDIGLKEYVMRRLKKNYHVTEFWADRHITFSLKRAICSVLSVQTALEKARC